MIVAEFTTEQAAKLSGLTIRCVDKWHRTDFICGSVPPPRRGVSRRYTFRDVVALRVAADLRKGGVSLQLLRKISDHLRNREDLSTSDALARINLVTDGDRVYEVTGDVTIQVPSGQRAMVFVVPLDRVVEEVQRKVRALHRRAAA